MARMTISSAALQPSPAGLLEVPWPAWLCRLRSRSYAGKTSFSCSPSAVSLPNLTWSILLRARFSATGVVAFCMGFPTIQIGVVAASAAGLGKPAWALVATMIYAPLFARVAWSYVRGVRPSAAGWTLAAMTLVIIGAVPFAGGWFLPAFFAPTVTGLILLSWRWSLLWMAGLTAAQVPLALAFPVDLPSSPPYFAFTLLWRTTSVFVPLWLVAAVRQLQAARRELAEDAVLRERLRVDSELRDTVGVALASIVARGHEAAALVERDTDSAGSKLVTLVQTSRGALTDTRQLLSGFRRPTLWAELATAADLLAAAGVETCLVVPDGDPPIVDAEFRSELRSIMARLLRDDAVLACAMTVTSSNGRVRLDIDVDGKQLASMAVSA